MASYTRRAVLAGGLAAGLSASLPTVGAKRPATSDTTVRLKVADTVENRGLCHLPKRTVSALGLSTGDQLRLVAENGPALFTVVPTDGTFGAVSPAGGKRLGTAKGSFRVDTDTQVVHPTMTRAAAAETGEFVERTVAGDTSLVVLAPHGGSIEYGTDTQALRVADTLGATGWYAAGWWPGGGAFRRWHVTSTYLSPRSFPRLGDLEAVGFDRAVSFHGWGESHIAVGGSAPLALKTMVRDAIATAVGGAIETRVATDATRSGTDPDNVVNWLTASGSDGLQIEQPMTARQEYGDDIADAVAGVYATLEA